MIHVNIIENKTEFNRDRYPFMLDTPTGQWCMTREEVEDLSDALAGILFDAERAFAINSRIMERKNDRVYEELLNGRA